MKMKMSFSKTLFIFVIWYETLTLSLAVIFPQMENKLFLLFMMYLYIYFNIKIARKSTAKLIIINAFLAIYIGYFLIHDGIYYVTHLDFYCYVGMAFIFLTFSDKDTLENFEDYLNHHQTMVICVCILFFLLVFISIPYRSGLRTGYGVKIPLLYGPYSIPHDLGYELLFIYCLAAKCYSFSSRNVFLVFKALCIIGIFLTAVRSAFAALAIIVFLDYCSMKSLNKKTILAAIGVIGILYLTFFTNVLTSLPIVQKTLAAISSGASFTNGREEFAQIVLDAWTNKTSTTEKVFGMSIEGVRRILKTAPTVNVAIHAHNDYVNVLCGYGIVGFFILIIIQLKPLKLWKSPFVKLMTEAFLFVLLYTNGLAMYCLVTPCLPILFLFAKSCMTKVVRSYNICPGGNCEKSIFSD